MVLSIRYGHALKAAAETLTGKPVARVYVTHLHPDHGMGIAAFDPAIVAALPRTIDDVVRPHKGAISGHGPFDASGTLAIAQTRD